MCTALAPLGGGRAEISVRSHWKVCKGQEGGFESLTPRGLSPWVPEPWLRWKPSRKKLLEKGGTAGDWGSLITNGLQAEDQLWTEGGRLGGDVLAQARAVMSRDAILEYDCVDDRGRDQGQALVRLLDWEDFSRGLLRAEHLVASDGYYEWYGSHELAGGKGVYHICSNPRGQCAERLGRSDRRQLIHMHRWRMTSPLVMMESAYAKPVALKAMENWVNNFQARVPSPSRPPAPPGAGGGNDTTGLDKEVEAAEEADEPAKKKASAAVKKAPVAEEVNEKTPRGSVGAVLERKAAERRETMRAREVEKKRARERARSRSRGRRRKKALRSDQFRWSVWQLQSLLKVVAGFSKALYPGGRTICGGRAKEKPREAAQDHRAGAESLFSRPSPRSRRRVRLDEPQDDGIHIPGGTVPTPTTSDGGSKPSRVGDAGKSYRSATEWANWGSSGICWCSA